MTPELWERVEYFFAEVADLQTEERAERLEEIGKTDPELYAELKSLIEAHDDADELLGGFEKLVSEPDFEPLSDPVSRLRTALESRYTIDREVGSGGMATVYLADDLKHERKVALKVLKPDLAAVIGADRFISEIKTTANLQHPHILPLFDSGESEGFLYYVMPFVDGETLGARLAREGGLPVPEAARILRDVVDGLAAAHRVGVVHCDIKPDNILISGQHAMISDFGVAKAVSGAPRGHLVTTVGVVVGTPTYMAPEQATADTNIDHRADIYAVGVLAYEMLTGRPPFHGMTAQQVLAAHITERPRLITELRSSVPPGLAALIARCLEKKPADRWQSAGEMLPHLEAVATPRGGATPTQLQPVTPKRKSWLPRAGVAVVVAGLAAVVISRVSGGGGGPAAVTPGEDERGRLIVVPLQPLVDDEELELWGLLAAEHITRAIDQPRPIDVIPTSVVRDASQRLGGNATTSDLARETMATHAVAGTVSRIGGQVRFSIEILDQRTGELIRALDPVIGPADSLEVVIGRLAQLTTGAVVVLLDPEATEWESALSVPPSIDVYRDHLEQVDLFTKGDYAGAIAMGERISARAPDYVPALLMAYSALANLGQDREMDSLRALLTPLRDRMTTVERLNTDYLSAAFVGDPEATTRAAEELYRLYPERWGYGAGRTARVTGRLEAAVERFLAYDAQHNWRAWFGWRDNLASTYHLLGRYEEELALARAEFANFPGDQRLHDYEARALVALGRLEEADSLVRHLANLPPQQSQDPLMHPVWVALELRVHGYEEESEALFEEVIAQHIAREPGNQYNRGRAYYYAKSWEDADTAFASILVSNPDDIDRMGFHGVILAKLGRREEALRISDQLGQIVRPYLRGWNIGWQARIAAALGEQDEAVRLTQRAFDNSWDYRLDLHQDPAFEDMWGYPPWEALVALR
ncbi:MAG: protein kinase [Gemmatimonadota bacterium]